MSDHWQAIDSVIRRAAFVEVAGLQRRFDNEIPWAALRGERSIGDLRFHLMSKAEGIYKPKHHPAALSVKTVMPRRGRTSRYTDELVSDGTAIAYDYKAKGGPGNAQNESLRLVMRAQLPIIYFYGVAPGVYSAVCPVYVLQDDATNRRFHLAPEGTLAENDQFVIEATSGDWSSTQSERIPDKGYATAQVLRRLHQRGFRRAVLSAYRDHCAMCSIKLPDFLDAAHIVPDSDERGRPTTDNGIALCGLHHRAFDRNLIDIDQDYRIQLDNRLREFRDGPIFEQAFKERHGERIHLPRRQVDHPSLDLLEYRRHLLRAA